MLFFNNPVPNCILSVCSELTCAHVFITTLNLVLGSGIGRCGDCCQPQCKHQHRQEVLSKTCLILQVTIYPVISHLPIICQHFPSFVPFPKYFALQEIPRNKESCLPRFWRNRIVNIALVEFPILAITVIFFTHFTKWNIFSQTDFKLSFLPP